MQGKLSYYWNIGSQPCRAVKTLLDLGHIGYDLHSLNLAQGQCQTQQFMSKNPLGMVPFLSVRPDFGLGESNAIMVYLCDRFPESLSQYYGQSLEQKARVNEYLSWYQAFFRPALMKIIVLKKYRMKNRNIPFTKKELNQAILDQEIAIRTFNQLLQGKDYIVNENLSIADLLCFFETSNLYYYGMQSEFDRYPHLKKWYFQIDGIPEVRALQKQWTEVAANNFKNFLETMKPIDQEKSAL